MDEFNHWQDGFKQLKLVHSVQRSLGLYALFSFRLYDYERFFLQHY